jgi:hypothetical protein
VSASLRPNPCAIPDRETCVSMLQEIMWDASRAPKQYRPSYELTLRYETVMHWLRYGKALPAVQQAEIRQEPSIAVAIGMAAWEAIGSPGPGEVDRS